MARKQSALSRAIGTEIRHAKAGRKGHRAKFPKQAIAIAYSKMGMSRKRRRK